MPRITPDDTASIFMGSGALQYPWYNVIEFTGINYVDESEEDWQVIVTVPDRDNEEHAFNHTIIMRTVRLIASKKGKDIPCLSGNVRHECFALAFGKADEVDFDADMADQIMQVAMFGEVVFC